MIITGQLKAPKDLLKTDCGRGDYSTVNGGSVG